MNSYQSQLASADTELDPLAPLPSFSNERMSLGVETVSITVRRAIEFQRDGLD